LQTNERYREIFIFGIFISNVGRGCIGL